MPLYTFYPCRWDGSSTTFEVFELAGDEEAWKRAAILKEQHPSCAFVTVWRGDSEVPPPKTPPKTTTRAEPPPPRAAARSDVPSAVNPPPR